MCAEQHLVCYYIFFVWSEIVQESGQTFQHTAQHVLLGLYQEANEHNVTRKPDKRKTYGCKWTSQAVFNNWKEKYIVGYRNQKIINRKFGLKNYSW